jgi:hypothetical protein
MKTVNIYLRSVKQDGMNHLAMFDSKGNGAIDTLETFVHAGTDVVWQLDCMSGIKSITKISPELKESKIFKTGTKKRLFCKGFRLHVSEDIKTDTREKYFIDYIPCNSEETVTIDPYLHVPPPHDN